MDTSEIKGIIIKSLDPQTDTCEIPDQLAKNGISYNFSRDFREKILNRVFSAGLRVSQQVEFVKYINFAFYRIALTGVAAIVVLLISIFLKEGSLSFNSLLGLSDNYNESIVCLLTGK
ncbi:MAG TPA: hypothetical protein VFE71_03660 [Bacteroidales bacterium]|nr:hypothetical protein [Bacteroidales bacterium]